MGFKYQEIIPWGRSYNEYLQMFQLSPEDLKKRILGVGDGPASFNAVMNENHHPVTSVDPIYRLPASQIKKRISETFDDVILQTRQNQHKFNWKNIKNPEHLGTTRMNAMEVFLNDYPKGVTQKRYIPGELPRLPFWANSYDLIISSHLLFFYSDNLSYEFHLESINEMLKISPEVRIFPLVDFNGFESPFLNDTVEYFQKAGVNTAKIKTHYEFQKNGHSMLKLVRQN